MICGSPVAADVTTTEEPSLLRMELGHRTHSLRWTPAGLSGATARLVRAGQTLKGTADVVDVALAFETGRLEGTVGGERVFTFLGHNRGTTDIEGQLGELPVNLTVGPERIAGALGGCSYALFAKGDEYRGFRLCSDSELPVMMKLRLPSALGAEPPAATAAVLVSLLAPMPGRQSPFTSVTSVQRFADTRAGTGGSGVAKPAVDGRLGLDLVDATEGGAKIAKVLPSSLAARSGLDEGMVIIRAGREDVRNAEELRHALRRASPGASIVLEVINAKGGRGFRSVALR